MGSVKVDIYRGEYEWIPVNLSDEQTIKGLLKYRHRFDLLFDEIIYLNNLNDTFVHLSDLKDEVICLYVWLDDVLNKCGLNEYECKVIDLYMNGYTEIDIADCYNTKKQNINQTINRICRKIKKYCFEKFQDWVYLNFIKGQYKKCSKCGEVKLEFMFSPNLQNIDGLHSYCKQCRLNMSKMVVQTI